MYSLNATQAALLCLLRDGTRNGHQLHAAANERFGAFLTVHRSHMYRELGNLAAEGLIWPAGKGEGIRFSRDYTITTTGTKCLRAWLRSDGTEFDYGSFRSPTMLRLVHAGALTSTQRQMLVAGAQERYGAEEAAAKAAVKTARGYAKAVAQFELDVARAALQALNRIPA